MNKPESTPFSPGTKSSRLHNITSLGWNHQVAHILATSSNTGYSVVWDLRNKREIMQLGSGIASSTTATPMGPAGVGGSTGEGKGMTAVSWNPSVPTQLVTASEDDAHPAILVWDLRNAHAPLRALNGHTKGVLSLSWSQWDDNLLLSSGKDCRTICWGVSTGEVLGEVAPPAANWVFDVQWSPANPAHFATASFDGTIRVDRLSGGSEGSRAEVADARSLLNPSGGGTYNPDPFSLTSSPSSASFPGAGPDVFGNAGTPGKKSEGQAQGQDETLEIEGTGAQGEGAGSAGLVLSRQAKPPQWLARPVGATWSFGGRLITFSSTPPATTSAEEGKETAASGSMQQVSPTQRRVTIRRFIQEKEPWVTRAQELEEAMKDSAQSEEVNKGLALVRKRLAEAEAEAQGKSGIDTWRILEVLYDGSGPGVRDRLVKLLAGDEGGLQVNEGSTEVKGVERYHDGSVASSTPSSLSSSKDTPADQVTMTGKYL